jgi:uncharacterized membrane protein
MFTVYSKDSFFMLWYRLHEPMYSIFLLKQDSLACKLYNYYFFNLKEENILTTYISLIPDCPNEFEFKWVIMENDILVRFRNTFQKEHNTNFITD